MEEALDIVLWHYGNIGRPREVAQVVGKHSNHIREEREEYAA